MKSIDQLKKQEPVFLHIWSDAKGVASSFGVDGITGIQILFASYGQDNYSGAAFVLYEEEGKLYEVHGSHCSCFGLEDQWKPEETTVDALAYRLEQGSLGVDDWAGNEFSAELCEFLEVK